MSDTGAYSILERSNWRRFDNGRYIGLAQNEVRASIIPHQASTAGTAHPASAAQSRNNSNSYQGFFFVLQSTLRDMRHSAQAVDAIVPASFAIMRDGSISIEDDHGFPMMRGFPSFPNQPVARGAKWRAPGKRAVDPFNTGQAIVIPFIAEYEYRGTEYYNGILVHRIYAIYSYNYRNEISPHPYARAAGNHKVDILIRAADGLPVLMRDDLTKTYTLANGQVTEFRGFTLTFGSSIAMMNRTEVFESLEKTLITEMPVIDTTGLQDSSIELAHVPEGIKLIIRDIRFIADSSEFLPAEVPRLDQLAQALRQIPDKNFLVEGHTASIGRPDSEMQLSIERAMSLINELVRRGINADRFI